jgi:plastocyanin
MVLFMEVTFTAYKPLLHNAICSNLDKNAALKQTHGVTFSSLCERFVSSMHRIKCEFHRS